MGIKFSKIWPSEGTSQRIPVFRMGRVASFGDHEIWQTPVARTRKGHAECWLCDLGRNRQIDELVAVIRMQPGMDIQIMKKGGAYGVNIYDKDRRVLEFAEFAEDGQGLKYPAIYKHITIDPARAGEAQLVEIS